MTRLAAFSILFIAATIAGAAPIRIVPAPTLSEYGLVGLGLIVAAAAGIGIRRRNRK